MCECRRRTLSIFLGPSMMRPPYFSMLIWGLLSQRSEHQRTPLPGMFANFALKKVYHAPPLSVSEPGLFVTFTAVCSGVICGRRSDFLLSTS